MISDESGGEENMVQNMVTREHVYDTQSEEERRKRYNGFTNDVLVGMKRSFSVMGEVTREDYEVQFEKEEWLLRAEKLGR